MKSVFIPFNQSYKDDLVQIFEELSIRGYTFWESVQGRGTKRGEPHYGSHAWPTMNSAILTVVEDDKVDRLLKALHALDQKTEVQGLHAFVWNVEAMI
jgi:nitrogen regulatory protein PII